MKQIWEADQQTGDVGGTGLEADKGRTIQDGWQQRRQDRSGGWPRRRDLSVGWRSDQWAADWVTTGPSMEDQEQVSAGPPTGKQ